MFDRTVALQQRVNRNNLRRDTMQSLQDMRRVHHPYATIYNQAYEVLEELGDDVEDAAVRLRVLPGTERRRYNLPTGEEVAVILPGGVRTRAPDNMPMLRISELHSAYSPLYYVFLFPRGEHG
jgi:hypothetical protein